MKGAESDREINKLLKIGNELAELG